MNKDGIYRYVRWDRVLDYHALGWIDLGSLPGPHGHWSTLMKACVCNASGKEPVK